MTTAWPSSSAGVRMANGRAWWPAVGLAVGLHALWFLAVTATPWVPVSKEHEPAPRTVFLREDPTALLERKLGSDVRALQSPSMFSLPTPMGFSRPMIGERRSLRPPLGGLVPEPSPAGMPANALPGESLSLYAQGSLLRGIPWARSASAIASEAFTAGPPTTGLVMRVLWMDAVSGLRNQQLPVEKGSVWDDAKPWEALAYVEFDDLGNVRHVLLEKPTASAERNEAIVRALRGYHSNPGELGQAGYVAIRFAGAEGVRQARSKDQP